MTAAERATALLEGREIDCPRCGVAPMQQQPAVDLWPFFGGPVEGRMACDNCGLVCSRALCSVSGQPGDETAALHLHQDGSRPIDQTLAKAREAGIEDAFRLLLGVFDAGRFYHSKVGAQTGLPAERLRAAMAEAEIGLLGLAEGETRAYWEVTPAGAEE